MIYDFFLHTVHSCWSAFSNGIIRVTVHIYKWRHYVNKVLYFIALRLLKCFFFNLSRFNIINNSAICKKNIQSFGMVQVKKFHPPVNCLDGNSTEPRYRQSLVTTITVDTWVEFLHLYLITWKIHSANLDRFRYSPLLYI